MTLGVANDLESFVIEGLRSFTGYTGAIEPADDLQEDLGIDSVEVVELVGSLLARTSTPNRRVDVDKIATVADLKAALEDVLPQDRG
ncbi:MAG: acyl carrier protein [Acidobacteria bacterium]|nr:acyl carrier protein [Acidobacteriota bacterium]